VPSKGRLAAEALEHYPAVMVTIIATVAAIVIVTIITDLTFSNTERQVQQLHDEQIHQRSRGSTPASRPTPIGGGFF
jgi:hypothetical protein